MQGLKKYGLLILTLVLLFFVYHKGWIGERSGNSPADRYRPRSNDLPVNGNSLSGETLDRHPAHLYYTRHARCRMGCRHITSHEVEEILENGEVNERKSDPHAAPCPTYALEGRTEESQHLRVVFAPCDHETKVITCIDLDHDYPCDCN